MRKCNRCDGLGTCKDCENCQWNSADQSSEDCDLCQDWTQCPECHGTGVADENGLASI